MTGDHARAPQREPGADAVSSDDSEYVPVRRETFDAITEMIGHSHEHDEQLRAAAYEQGRQAHLSGGYQTGFTLGHDTGLSARQDTRGYVHGILDGFQAGSEKRHQLAGELLRRDQARHTGSRRPNREAEAP
jgi:flagellar biosynthesis/type III secretory pathway protein FliH